MNVTSTAAGTGHGAPPGWAGLRGFALVRRAIRDPLPVFVQMAARGDVAQARFGNRRLVLLSHPELVRELLVATHRHFHKSRTLQRARVLLGDGLLTSEDDLHLRQRRLVQPAFHRPRVESYGRTMVALAEHAAARWRDGGTVEIHEEMMRLTLAIAGATLFSADVEDEADAIGAALTTVIGMFDRLNNPFAPILDRLPTPRTRRFHGAMRRLEATIQRIVTARREAGDDRGDLLSMLLFSEEGAPPMCDRLVRDEALTLLLAGHETTANALTWCWLLLAEHPDVARRLHSELDAVLGGSAPTPDDAPRLSYTRRVLTEAMRLYPPAWIVGRQATADVEIGGYAIERGTMLFASQWVLHRDTRFFADPLRFDPDRWENPAAGRGAYFPFGAGVRKCIGEAFAWMEGTLVLATLAQRFRLSRLTSDEVGVKAMITLRPDRPVPMRVHARS